MTLKKKRLLFIPADVIRNEVSRSFYFTKGLADHFDVYFLSRFDPQSAFFENKKRSKLYTLQCFVRSIFSRFNIEKHQKWDYQVVTVPFMSHMVIYRFIGMVGALKLSRRFNKAVLRYINRKLRPDIIFYSEGFDLYPRLQNVVCVSDIQDDFDQDNFRNNSYNIAYLRRQLAGSQINFVVSRAAASKLGEIYNCKFVFIPNGAEVTAMRAVEESVVAKMIDEMGLKGKFLISYIGADAWYDMGLCREVFRQLWERDPSIHFLMVGNLPFIQSENVTYTGPVSKESSYFYYRMSDMGILLKDSKGSNFLYNSIPLKIIQYGVVGRWFVSPPIAWLEENRFKNVFLVDDFTPENLVDKILEIKANSSNRCFDDRWNEYDWQQINDRVLEVLSSIGAKE
ncbi:MAG: glycosyltransferase family 4 protein [Chitinophagaceae bacterium]|nr:glycosyltransferase family 4 protein [Chitinophagaceae bacterium]MCW5926334.1 glycosyltransferase family 4 protein [Chitinophagaceae bacterium]